VFQEASVSLFGTLLVHRLARWFALTGAVGLVVGCAEGNPAFMEVDAKSDASGSPDGSFDIAWAPDGLADAVSQDLSFPGADSKRDDSSPGDLPPGAAGDDAPSSDVGLPDAPHAPDVRPPDGPVSCTSPVNGSGTGLLAEYFDNSDFTGKRVSRVDPRIDFSFGEGSPDPGLGSDNFSARWTGQLQPVFSGPHTFVASYDDGMRMFLDERVVIYRWGPRLAAAQDSATVVLEAGRKYDLRFEFFDQGSAATARLSWENPCKGRQVVPQAQLYPVPPVPPSCPVERAAGSGNGLKVEYFARESSQSRLATGTHGRLDFDWGNGAPAAGVPADFFARWTASLEAPIDGPLTIYLSTDDVGRLRLDGVLLLDSSSEPFGPQEVAVTIDVRAGQRYGLSIDLRDDTGGAFIHLYWSWPCHPREIVPGHRLYAP
jgi:hypothetical protein